MTRMQTMKAAIAAAAVIVAVGAAPAYSQPRWGDGEHQGRRMGRQGVPFAQLDLSADQREEIRKIVEQHRAERQAIAAQVRAARKAQADAVSAMPVDEAAIRAKSADLVKAETDAALLRARVHAQVFNVLTPDQQTKANALRAERQQKRQERMHERQERMQERQQRRPQPPAPPQ